jgi:hypothetical protein
MSQEVFEILSLDHDVDNALQRKTEEIRDGSRQNLRVCNGS